MKNLEPNATRDTIVKKINNLRCAFRKEQKVKISKVSGASADDLCTPKLWYYNHLHFRYENAVIIYDFLKNKFALQYK